MEPIVFSSSAIAAFKRCPKSYQLGYEMGLQPDDTVKDYVHQGSNFHALAAAHYTRERTDANWSDMLDVWSEYLAHQAMPEGVLSVEAPTYSELLPDVWVRTTFDLVYERGRGEGPIVGRDYKTFDRAPTLDLDLDFQGRFYIAALMRKYEGREVEFEYEYVRRVPPGTKNSRGVWTPEDCYLRFPLIISRREADVVWEEAKWVVESILRAQDRNRFWRTDLKGASPHTCGSCFYRNLCKAELEHGELSEQDLAILSPNRKEPITLPKELYVIPT